MTTPVILVTPDTSIESLTDVLLERGISAVPVVDADGRPVGIVSKTDLLRELRIEGDNVERVRDGAVLEDGMHEERVTRSTAGEVMTPVVVSVQVDTPISAAAGLMAWERIHRVPVMDQDARVVGIVSALDILEWMAVGDGFVIPHGRARHA